MNEIEELKKEVLELNVRLTKLEKIVEGILQHYTPNKMTREAARRGAGFYGDNQDGE